MENYSLTLSDALVFHFNLIIIYWGFFTFILQAYSKEIMPSNIEKSIKKKFYCTLWLFIALIIIASIYDITTIVLCKHMTINVLTIAINFLPLIILIIQFSITYKRQWLPSYYNDTMEYLQDKGKAVSKATFEEEFKKLVTIVHTDNVNDGSNCFKGTVDDCYKYYLKGALSLSDIDNVNDAYKTFVFLINHPCCCMVHIETVNTIQRINNKLENNSVQ